jgi:hypothetical protein
VAKRAAAKMPKKAKVASKRSPGKKRMTSAQQIEAPRRDMGALRKQLVQEVSAIEPDVHREVRAAIKEQIGVAEHVYAAIVNLFIKLPHCEVPGCKEFAVSVDLFPGSPYFKRFACETHKESLETADVPWLETATILRDMLPIKYRR